MLGFPINIGVIRNFDNNLCGGEQNNKSNEAAWLNFLFSSQVGTKFHTEFPITSWVIC